MAASSHDNMACFTYAECDYAQCTCDLTHVGNLDMNSLNTSQTPSQDFVSLPLSPPPTDSSSGESIEWADFQEESCSPTESTYIASPVITFVRTERKERRKAQNREAQRAYRSRKDEQMKALKQELIDISNQLKRVTEAYNSAIVENTLLTCVVQELQQNLKPGA